MFKNSYLQENECKSERTLIQYDNNFLSQQIIIDTF